MTLALVGAVTSLHSGPANRELKAGDGFGRIHAVTYRTTVRQGMLRDSFLSGIFGKRPLLLGSWMGVVVDLEHVLDGELGVALSSGEALMAQHLLNGAQVGAFLQQMSAEGVP